LNTVATVIRQLSADPAGRSTVSYFCFPHASVAASAFRAIAAERDADVWAVQYPGREDRAGEPLPTSLTQLVDEGVDAVATMCAEHRIDGFVLVGASMGGLVAFEVAQRLQTLGHPARALVVVGSIAPHSRRGVPKPPPSEEGLTEYLADQAVAHMLDADPDGRDHYLAVLSCDVRLTHAYPGPVPTRLSTAIVALCGTDDEHASSGLMTHQWAIWGSGQFDWRLVPGGHLFFMTPDGARGYWQAIDQLSTVPEERSFR